MTRILITLAVGCLFFVVMSAAALMIGWISCVLEGIEFDLAIGIPIAFRGGAVSAAIAMLIRNLPSPKPRTPH